MTHFLKRILSSVFSAAVFALIMVDPGTAVTDEDLVTGKTKVTFRTVSDSPFQYPRSVFSFAVIDRDHPTRFSPGGWILCDILDLGARQTVLLPLASSTLSTRTATATAEPSPSPQPPANLPTSLGRMESGNTTGVVDLHGGPLAGGQRQSLPTMTPEQRDEMSQHIRLIQCRIKNCCGPEANK